MFKRFTAGFAVGYVFGAQAGQKRYEQITDLAQRVADTRVVTGLADRASEYWTPGTARNLMSRIGERMSPGSSDGGQAAEDEDEGPYDFDDEDEEDLEDGGTADDPDAEPADEPDDAYAEEDDEGTAEDGSGADDTDEQDSGEQPESNGRRSRAHRSRPAAERPSPSRRGHKDGGIRSLAASARERGRVD